MRCEDDLQGKLLWSLPVPGKQSPAITDFRRHGWIYGTDLILMILR